MDYYDDAEPSGEQGSTQGATDHEADSGKTALIDSSICPGAKPGDIISIRVEKVLDSGELMVSHVSDKEEESPETEPQSTSYDQGEMSDMYA